LFKTFYSLDGYLKVIFYKEISPFSTFLILPYYFLTSILLGSSIIVNIFYADNFAILALGTADIAKPAPKADVKIIYIALKISGDYSISFVIKTDPI
jgi:hypothetical protein